MRGWEKPSHKFKVAILRRSHVATMEMKGFVDYRGRPISRATTGGWASARYIMVEEVAERFAFCGIYSNLITFLTTRLGLSTAAAAANVNAWYGTSGLLPSLMGFIADAYVGRFRMVIFSALLYILTLFLLATIAGLPSSQTPASETEIALTFCVLYAMTVAQGGHKPCAQAFGADQFDVTDHVECRLKSSFFNWWYVAMYVGNLAGILILNYVQDELSWALGFGIAGAAMSSSLIVFLCGTKAYRNHVLDNDGGGIVRALWSRWISLWKTPRSKALKEPLLPESPIKSGDDGGSGMNNFSQTEEEKEEEEEEGEAEEQQVGDDGGGKKKKKRRILQLMPIWCACLIYAVIFAQPPTLFTKQGATLDRSITSEIQIPPAALQSLICITIAIFVPIYDRLLVPLLRRLTSRPSGLSTLQRVGAGISLSAICMVVAAVVESRRLSVAGDMTLWWLVPQYVLFGVAESLTNVGLLEFFYDEMPRTMVGFGLGLYLGIFGIGSFLSSFLISLLDGATDWFNDDLNQGHLDHFYWLLAGLSALELLAFLFFASSYVYRRKSC